MYFKIDRFEGGSLPKGMATSVEVIACQWLLHNEIDVVYTET